MSMDTLFNLTLPAQEALEYEHFPLREDAARAWAAQLPVTNIRDVSHRLLDAIGDLNHFPTRPERRFQVLDALSEHLRVTLTNLTRRFLNQPLVMPAGPQQLADRTDSLLRQLQLAYAIIATQTLAEPDSVRETNPARLLCESLYRAVHYTGRRILLAYQLHRPAPLGCWLTLHKLYALAEYQDLARLPVAEREGGTGSVVAAYLQALMLGCSKPNQLRQSDLEAVYQALGQWSGQLEIGKPDELQGLFAVDLGRDQPAIYRSLYGDNRSAGMRSIDTGPLIHLLGELRSADEANQRRGVKLETGTVLSSNMLGHLVDALGTMSMRNFKRVMVEGPVQVAPGIAGAHFHAAGERNFARLIHGDDKRPQLSVKDDYRDTLKNHGQRDVWRAANPGSDYLRDDRDDDPLARLSHQIDVDAVSREAISKQKQEKKTLTTDREVPVFRARQINASPGGYCLEWDNNLPDEVRTGDIICIQENPNSPWSIGVLRWVSRVDPQRTLSGLELLSPQATACGAQSRRKVGDQLDPQRALLLPEIKLVGQPATLVTPRTGFGEGMKVTLYRHGETRHVHLTRQISATASYAQFEFRDMQDIDEVLSKEKSGLPKSAYDSVWSNI
ncbi:hypothetical protein E4634_13860 [Mangrovimicrobium sediminis]|uniref:GTPase n=1 Tax=Mangrovimicrobium sediminis TaxID=2562682 RepID=A0A4Z0LZY1_9GAMM|nr:hypothetical protein [Haliea sp. SAOS-164]TGD72605.1 hypothetical protein E4634_13860 [Haliea sp. SAOS-164]